MLSSLCNNLIALIALSLQLISLWKNRRLLDVEIDESILSMSGKDMYVNGKKDIFDAPLCFLGSIKVINPSLQKNITYFDLQAINPQTGQSLALITKQCFPVAVGSEVSVEIDKKIINLELPANSHGVFMNNSFTHFDVLIYEQDPQSYGDKIVVSFKTLLASKRKKYQTYERTFVLHSAKSVNHTE